MPRKTKLSDSEVKKISTPENLRSVRDGGYGRLRDYSGSSHRVEMRWDLNKWTKADQIFELQIDGLRVLLDWEEVQKLGRWV